MSSGPVSSAPVRGPRPRDSVIAYSSRIGCGSLAYPTGRCAGTCPSTSRAPPAPGSPTAGDPPVPLGVWDGHRRRSPSCDGTTCDDTGRLVVERSEETCAMSGPKAARTDRPGPGPVAILGPAAPTPVSRRRSRPSDATPCLPGCPGSAGRQPASAGPEWPCDTLADCCVSWNQVNRRRSGRCEGHVRGRTAGGMNHAVRSTGKRQLSDAALPTGASACTASRGETDADAGRVQSMPPLPTHWSLCRGRDRHEAAQPPGSRPGRGRRPEGGRGGVSPAFRAAAPWPVRPGAAVSGLRYVRGGADQAL
jgi:hypothetical protein